MTHTLSAADRAFRDDFLAGRIAPAAFDHRAHVRLAFTRLAETDVDGAVVRMRDALQALLARHGVDARKYHETLTRAWLLMVRHCMAQQAAVSAEELLRCHPQLLDTRLLLAHYSAERLASAEARSAFVAPDRAPFPERDGACGDG